MNTNEAAQLATLLLDTYAAAEQAKAEKTRSTVEARHLGHVDGTFTGVVRYAELACKAHGSRITRLVGHAHRMIASGEDFAARHNMASPAARVDYTAALATELVKLAERTACDDQILWRDEDVAMARKDLAPFRCLRTPGHDGTCEMHPTVAGILNRGGVPDHEDYLAPVSA